MNKDLAVRDSLATELAREWNIPMGKGGEDFLATFLSALGVKGMPIELVRQFLFLCKDHGLNPMRRELWAFESKGRLLPMVSIDGWLSILRRQDDYLTHSLAHGKDPMGAYCEITIERKGRPPFVHRCYRHEWEIATSPVWKARPLHMLGVRTTCQGIRMCYGVGGIHIEGDIEIMASRTEQVRDIAADAVVSGGYDDPVPELDPVVVDVSTEPEPEPPEPRPYTPEEVAALEAELRREEAAQTKPKTKTMGFR